MSTKDVDRFLHSLMANKETYGINLTDRTVQKLGEYYTLLTRWNERLHLVAPCSPEEFATRHVLESLLLLRFLSSEARVVDIGSGAGLPIMPCLIARSDLNATLIESSQKKSVFLREALNQTGVSQRGVIIAKRFEDVAVPDAVFVTSRALDDFINKVSTLINWAPSTCTLLLYGGETLRRQLDALEMQFTEFLVPLSDRRFLFTIQKRLHGS